MRRVVVESPYAGDIPANEAYARRCLADCLARGESPVASHLLLTQPGVLKEDIPEERLKGIAAGLAWHAVADAVVFYTDRGTSRGMLEAEKHAADVGAIMEYRSIGA